LFKPVENLFSPLGLPQRFKAFELLVQLELKAYLD
jgi:hypothetical protein